MSKKKIKRKSKFKDLDIFQLGVYIALEPVDWTMRSLKYPYGVLLSFLIMIIWSVGVLLIASIAQILSGLYDKLIKLILRK